MVELKICKKTNEKFMLEWISEYGNQCGARLQDINYVKITKSRLVYINGKFTSILHKKFPVFLNLDLMELELNLYNIVITNDVDLNIQVKWKTNNEED